MVALAGEAKDRWDDLPRDALRGAMRGFAVGRDRHRDNHWSTGLPWMGYWNSAMRHLAAFADGQDIDEESGVPHIDLAQCNIMMMSASQKRGIGIDDRGNTVVLNTITEATKVAECGAVWAVCNLASYIGGCLISWAESLERRHEKDC